ncbi:MAG: bifunctional diaminohydroxyphosphoribosylaminopyrimidine deaminase/5-amino-6-(5-phosphoribosylamino)uracil reductase RibD [Myxococcales bacterium]|nr:bifunctional diaminohydroxyphosphoribosylaminopyrimidine deaminase/5-amino-6-(5-phosphoribosylamino)uracil reductase RibD [Myxococcales bacterium]USN50357.1 MAG: bifunctional diaminohydroxyphosphoribosylaminopyrimidine deaminase/5-amino-6-(5-phosphoribosylamino)uracil reductase RibD [Myxococcales bacterium]
MSDTAFSWIVDEKVSSCIEDDKFFLKALDNAHFASGSTHPNPSVGAVIVKHGRIIAEGYTQKAGGMHAEKHAMSHATDSVEGATLYVTLEPCCHSGRTPPCTDAIINARIARVVYGLRDPNPLVAGKGIKQLEKAGIQVGQIKCDALRSKAKASIEPFSYFILKKRPYVILKIATSSDYALALVGERTQITGPQSNKIVHRLRRAVDAIVIGANTLRIDNPQLRARDDEPNHGTQAIRVVLSSNLNLDLSFAIFDTSVAPTWIFYEKEASLEKIQQFLNRNIKLIKLKKITIQALVQYLYDLGITSLLVEAGKNILSSFMAENLIDEMWWFRSQQNIGDDGLQVFEQIKKMGLITQEKIIVGDDELRISMLS